VLVRQNTSTIKKPVGNSGKNVSAVNLVAPPSHQGSPIRRKGVTGVSFFQRYHTIFASTNRKQRAKKYDKKLQLKESVELDDLIGVALKTPPDQAPKAKRAKGKKKK
jgi:hypothetical protein